MDTVSESLIAAQNEAAALFTEVVDSGMIRARQIGGFFEELLTI
jgi:hypothetical protein